MKIAVIGAGAMGSLYGGYLSEKNEVYLIDTDCEKEKVINKNGIKIKEVDKYKVFYPKVILNSNGIGEMDLIIVFVKAIFSKQALEANKSIIGKNTFVLTLQNGAGHEDILSQFVSKEHIIIGTTEHNSSIIETGYINHGGSGKTNIGMLTGNTEELNDIAKTFNECGFETYIQENIQELIWNKLFVNISASALTGVLQVSLDYLSSNEHAWFLVEKLVDEALAVSKGLGMSFKREEIIEKVKSICVNSHNGFTSIYADIRDHRKTEVDTISGAVVRASKQCNIPAPCNEFIVQMIHALEGKIK